MPRRRRARFKEMQDRAVGRADVCECCCNGIDGLDAGARHLCGKCSHKELGSPYDELERKCSRIHELEHVQSQMRDAAAELKLQPVSSGEWNIEAHWLDKIDELGEWSTLKDQEATIGRLRDKNQQLLKQREELLKWVEKAVGNGGTNRKFKAACAAHRLGGKKAMRLALQQAGAL